MQQHTISLSLTPPLSLPFTDTRIHTLLSFCVTFARGSGLAPLSLEHSRTNHWNPVLALHTRGACGAWIRHQGSEQENQPCSLFLPPHLEKHPKPNPFALSPRWDFLETAPFFLMFDNWEREERVEGLGDVGAGGGARGLHLLSAECCPKGKEMMWVCEYVTVQAKVVWNKLHQITLGDCKRLKCKLLKQITNRYNQQNFLPQ